VARFTAGEVRSGLHGNPNRTSVGQASTK
jgi:hypothetical protein